MKIGVRIMPRSELLDSQGRAVFKLFKDQGKNIESVRVGRYVELDIRLSDKDQALKHAEEMAESVLHNPLIENYRIEIL
ncbi:MAG: phosphoribosylformylglycinamidine synthase subunit PurS [Pseudomonadota bacterium]|nr:phosphoribosylformylglycinamidine synthase subunit PurS [Pseudomonadota bacterium]